MADMTSSTPIQKSVLMIAYTNYYYDARVRREAETLVQTEQFRVTFLTLRTGEHKKMFDLAGVRVIELNQRGYQGNSKVFYIFSYIEFLIRAFLKCTWLFFKGRIDIVHVHNMPDFLVFAALVPRMFGRKLILDIHDSVPETYLSKFTDRPSLLYKLLVFLEAACIAVAHKIICVNHVQKEILVDRGVPPAKITISINTPDPLLFPINRAPAAIQTSNSFFRLVYHGTIAERLGIDLTVQALARLCSRIPNLEFHLWGPTGPRMEAIERLAKSLNVDDRVRTRPGVPLEQVASGLKIMNVGVISNRRDMATDLMLPVKMLEYIALSIPVVAPRLKCIQYYFDDSQVSFFDPGSVDSMAAAILALYQDPDRRRLQAQNALKFLERYGWENHKKDLIHLYENL